MRSYRVDAIVSTDAAVKTGAVKHGMTSQLWRDLHVMDNRLSLVNNSMHVAMKRRTSKQANQARQYATY